MKIFRILPLFFTIGICMTISSLLLVGHAAAQNKSAEKPHKRVCEITNNPEAIRCHAHVIVDDSGKPHVSLYPFAYGPLQLQNAYGLTGNAGGKILAIVDAYDDPQIKFDLDTYNSTFGLPVFPSCIGAISTSTIPCFQKVNQSGGNSYPSVDAGWALEISLDVEVAHASCPSCKLLLVEATSSSYADLLTAEDRAVTMGALAVSNSYGSGEFRGETNFDSHFKKPSVAFTFSTGDNGYGTSYPASSQYVTAVGGTSLFLNTNSTYNSESAWSGTGSGCSLYEPRLSFQPFIGCLRRVIADVSADADPNTGAAVYDSVPYSGQTGWFQVGGTSLSSPIVAAAYMLGGIPNSAMANTLPYISPSNLHDITTGSNGFCKKYKSLCTAVVGFDGPTGLGTPNGTSAF